jgi:NADPH2:quinone reductase
MVKARAIRVHQPGGPEAMRLEEAELPEPAPGEVRLRQAAVGFNFIDIYQRKGLYPLPLPTGLGHEAAGTVEAVGAAVQGFKPGDRVGYINAGIGAYADRRNVAADKLIALPPGLSDEKAAAVLFKGLTAQYLLRRTYKVGKGDLILVHTAAGGVGSILCRWGKALGAAVVGTVGGEAKRAAARAAGCDHVIDYSREGWTKAFLDATGGRKANVVYDAVAKDTFLHSLDCAAPFGMVVLYGAASGPAPAIEPELLNKKGCLYLTRPSIFPHNADVQSLRANAADMFAWMDKGAVDAAIGARFALAQAAEAHRAVESRATQGAVVLIP